MTKQQYIRLRSDVIPLSRPSLLEMRTSSSIHQLPGDNAYQNAMALQSKLSGQYSLSDLLTTSSAGEKRVLVWLLEEKLVTTSEQPDLSFPTSLERYRQHLGWNKQQTTASCIVHGEGSLANKIKALLPFLDMQLCETEPVGDEIEIYATDGEVCNFASQLTSECILVGLCDGLGIVESVKSVGTTISLNKVIAKRNSNGPLSLFVGRVDEVSSAGTVFEGLLAQQATLRAFEQANGPEKQMGKNSRVLALDPRSLRAALLDFQN